jgi:glutamyl-tRNA synthetase
VIPEEEIRRHAIRNAFMHSGVADIKAVSSKIFGEFPEARKSPKETLSLIAEVVSRVNSLGSSAITELVQRDFPEFLVKEERKEDHRLPDLNNVKGHVVMRLAPSPSGPLHLGHTRMAMLNDEYVSRYGGELILRLEDTNPANIDPEAYEMIPQDLENIGVKIHRVVIQSERMEIYYEEARRLIESGHAYVCLCKAEDMRKLKLQSIACPHRNTTPEQNEKLFDDMIGGKFTPGTATLVIRTDLFHPNPSLRDWIAFRISPAKHPRTGEKYYAFPMMNFSVAVDDHRLGLTHVLRGKDQLNNTDRQRFIFQYSNWQMPEYYHYGMISLPGEKLKTSIIRKGIRDGKYSGWDDVRLNTVRALLRRGYKPETFRRYWVESGLREIDASFSWDIFNSMNRELIDGTSLRLFFVRDPVPVLVKNGPKSRVMIPFHPEHRELGFREMHVGGSPTILIQAEDWNGMSEGSTVRLKDLYNVERSGDQLVYKQNQEFNPKTMKIIHWLPEDSGEFTVLKPDGSRDDGRIESNITLVNGTSQFERYGYVTIEKERNSALFLHR